MGERDLDRLLKRGVAEIISEEELKKLLGEERPLKVKQGFDPSRPDIHLGHVVGLRKLRQFQDLGHQVILIVGDWTAQIGDPSGQSATRLMLSPDEVKQNAATYLKQFFKVVDREKTQVVWQSQWYDRFTLQEVIRLSSKFTVAHLLAREDFEKRFSANRPIALTELLYPLLQAYDSVAIGADVELGGTDQKFNCLMGRELQTLSSQPPQQVFLVPLLVGTDGVRKMSKSLDNYIGITEPPKEMFGKVMSLPDNLIVDYLELVTDIPDGEIAEIRGNLAEGKVNPMEVKKRLAREIVAQFHSQEAAERAEGYFTRVFQEREVPEEVPERYLHPGELKLHLLFFSPGRELPFEEGGVHADIPELLFTLGLTKSRGEAKRLLNQGAVEIDGRKALRQVEEVRDGSLIRVGKRRFMRLRLTNPGTAP